MKKIAIVTAIVTIVLFSLEACCTYNLGKHKIEDINKENIKNIKKMFSLPPIMEVIKILVTIIVFYLSSLLIIHILKIH